LDAEFDKVSDCKAVTLRGCNESLNREPRLIVRFLLTFDYIFPDAVSQEVPEVPVLNRASGHLYERRVVEKYIQENGKDPVTAVECTVDDLIDVKGMI
jgi:hypothetical protein